MKKIVTLCIIILPVILLTAAGCQQDKGGAPAPAPAPTPAPAPGPSRMVMFERLPDIISLYGENVEINLTFTNEASEPRIISPFKPEIKIIELPNLRPPDSVVRTFPAGNGEIKLQPGASTSHLPNWDQKDDGGEQVPPGWYSVEVTLTSRKASEATGGHVRGSAARVLVLPPKGVLEKTISVNRSQTVNGITVTLERVELTATGMKIYAFNTPPDYALPQGPMLPPPQFMSLHAEAQYRVDGGAIKQTNPSGIRFLENGMQHTWDDYLDPVPKGAKELTFTITKIGNWEGPWEFIVPLE